jgi:hypothetical protein
MYTWHLWIGALAPLRPGWLGFRSSTRARAGSLGQNRRTNARSGQSLAASTDFRGRCARDRFDGSIFDRLTRLAYWQVKTTVAFG